MLSIYNYKDLTPGDFAALEAGTFVGVIYNLPDSKYHSLSKYTSSSDLKYLYKTSPYHFKNRKDFKESADMVLGSVVHCLILEPQEFTNKFYVTEKFDRRTKDGKAAYEAAMAECGDKTMIDMETLEAANTMCDNIKRDDHALTLLADAKCEVSIFWRCNYSQLPLRARCDGIFSGCNLIELKTSRSAHPKEFERQAYNMHYDLSVKHYQEGISTTTGGDRGEVFFIVVENDEPYAAQVYKADDSFIQSGHLKWMEAVDKMSQVDNLSHASYSDEILPLSAPRWSGVAITEENEDGI